VFGHGVATKPMRQCWSDGAKEVQAAMRGFVLHLRIGAPNLQHKGSS
jgi:hypothetical protein